MPIRWITITKFHQETGYSEDAIRSKIKRGDWVEGEQWIKAPDGRILMSLEGYNLWAESQGSMLHQAAV